VASLESVRELLVHVLGGVHTPTPRGVQRLQGFVPCEGGDDDVGRFRRSRHGSTSPNGIVVISAPIRHGVIGLAYKPAPGYAHTGAIA
jgi:hypothetical protein